LPDSLKKSRKVVCERVGGFFGMIFALIIQIATTKKEVKIQAKQKKNIKRKMVVLTFFLFFFFAPRLFFLK
jgi:hypothetical protein